MLAGTRIERTIVASISTATPAPKPISWNITRSPAAKPANTATMISAAPVISRPVERTPKHDGLRVVVGLVVALADAAQQEDVVVHREAEEDGEQEDRQPGLDALDLLEAEQAGADALLRHQHEQPVRGAHGEQVHDDGLDRHDDRPEDDQSAG